jgi:cysteine-S-conjugate beta-lyase
MNFDRIIDRRGTFSLKWDNPNNGRGLKDIIPLWVADMDFAPPDAVLEAIRVRALHPIFGYTNAAFEYNEAVAAWYAARQGLDLPPEHILMGPAVMPAIAAILHAFTEKGEAVMILPPVYRPFFGMPEENGRVVVTAPLALSQDGAWTMDFEAMGRAAEAAEASGRKLRAIIVSSPHNPVGRVWSEAELGSLLDFARGRGLVLVCDEIHSDIILGERKFFSMASVSGEGAKGLIVLSGPNKTFNLAGLHLCQAIARDDETRGRMKKAISAWGFDQPNIFSLAAAAAAYREGGPWLDELLAYLRGNYAFLLEFLSKRLPDVGVSELEGSYLAWLDLRSFLAKRGEGPSELILAKRLEEEGRVRLNPGSIFGKEGEGFMRLNLACPRSLLSEGLERFGRTIEKGR